MIGIELLIISCNKFASKIFAVIFLLCLAQLSFGNTYVKPRTIDTTKKQTTPPTQNNTAGQKTDTSKVNTLSIDTGKTIQQPVVPPVAIDTSKKVDFDKLPIFHTRQGRPVFAGGGITPDYIVKQDTITKLGFMIRNKNLFFDYSNQYMKGSGKNLKAKYEENFSDFLRNFTVTEEMMEEFKKLAISKDIKWDEENYKTDKDFFKVAIKGSIARTIWDRNKMTQIYMVVDRQLQKAIELFPDAMRISRLK